MAPQNPILQLGDGSRVVYDVILNAAQFAAQFSGIPALGPVVGSVVLISQACANVVSNREECRQLDARCQCLLDTVKDSCQEGQEGGGSDTTRIIEICTSQLEEIKRVVIPHSHLNRWESFFKQRQISKDIHLCHTKLDDCCREFQIRSHLQLHHWMDEYQKAKEEDLYQLLPMMMELKENQERMAQIIAEHGTQVTQLLGLMQMLLGILNRDSTEYRSIQQSLYNVHERSGVLPPEIVLKAGDVQRIGEFAARGGPAFDIWEGVWLGRKKVAVKIMRGVQRITSKEQERFFREMEIWRQVWSIDQGRYILPFYGACLDDGPHPYMISPWIKNGNVIQYLKSYPDANRREIIKGIANGLSLLHNFKPPIAHGDVKAVNILIDDKGHPLLADFGLSKMLEDVTGVPFTQSKGVSDSYRWLAPELCIDPGILSMYSDVFAYGMTVVEIYTGEPPFQHIKRNPEVLIQMQKGDRPRKPTDPKVAERGFDDHLWEMVNTCWTTLPEDRPTIDDILARL